MQTIRRSPRFAIALLLCSSVHPQCFVAGSVRRASWNAISRVARRCSKLLGSAGKGSTAHSSLNASHTLPNTASSPPEAADGANVTQHADLSLNAPVFQTLQQLEPAGSNEEGSAEAADAEAEEEDDAESEEENHAESGAVAVAVEGRFGNYEAAAVVSAVEEEGGEDGMEKTEKNQKLLEQQREKAVATIAQFFRAGPAKLAQRRSNISAQRGIDEQRFQNSNALTHIRTALNEHSKHGAELFQHHIMNFPHYGARPFHAAQTERIKRIEQALKSGPSFVWWRGVFLEPRTHRTPRGNELTDNNWQLATRFMENGVNTCVNEVLEGHVAEFAVATRGEVLPESDKPLVAELQQHNAGAHEVLRAWTEYQSDGEERSTEIPHPAITSGTLVVGNRNVPSYYAGRPGRWWLKQDDECVSTNESKSVYCDSGASAFNEKLWGQAMVPGFYQQQPVYVPAGNLPESAKFSQCLERQDRPLLFARACEARGEYYSSKSTNFYGAFIDVDVEKGGDLLVTLLSYEANCCAIRRAV